MFGDKAFKEERERRCEWRGGTRSILKNKGPKPLRESKVTSRGGREELGWVGANGDEACAELSIISAAGQWS